jgi:hypothetical protein
LTSKEEGARLLAGIAGTRLSQFLLQEGFTCRYVPAILTERERKHSVQHDKSDYLDAKRVGKVLAFPILGFNKN